jgi:hypothetical protein
MRPQDIVVLLKIISKGDRSWQNKDLAYELSLSPSEISESLNRSNIAGLINSESKNVHRQSLLEFKQYGLHYVFPVTPGGPSKGTPTAHSHPILRNQFQSGEIYVWPDIEGNEYGLSIAPLYKDVVKTIRNDDTLYTLLAMADVLRVGRVRETGYAITVLKQMILNERPH